MPSDPLLSVTAIQVQITGRETLGEWAKFSVDVMSIFKKKGGSSALRRGQTYMWVRMDDLMCKCPKVRLHRMYLVLSREDRDSRKPGLILDRKSIVIPWKDDWQRRLSRFRQYDKRGQCWVTSEYFLHWTYILPVVSRLLARCSNLVLIILCLTVIFMMQCLFCEVCFMV